MISNNSSSLYFSSRYITFNLVFFNEKAETTRRIIATTREKMALINVENIRIIEKDKTK